MRDETAVERSAYHSFSVAEVLDCYFCQGTGWLSGWIQPRRKCRNCHAHGWNMRQKPSALAASLAEKEDNNA